ncbi:hypothetical protein [Levilactobacillus wangkuiensis]|uniref:hypothetical protein n=1 Tax=Levilactobacillus wangkuiensis TaxID=2799566 RepID=UPI001940E866|nr:hypothetical protein [Levilactobacillus wangkuiensis]
MKKMMLAVATAVTLLAVGGVSLGTPVAAQAKTKTTLKAVPQRYRHTWYHYEHGKMDTLTFSTKRISGLTYYDGQAAKYVAHIHHHKLSAKKFKKHYSWSTVTNKTAHQAQWINVRGWNQIMGDGDYYKVMTKTYHGKKISVLSQAGGAGIWTSAHYYRTKQLAKQRGPRYFSNEVYYPMNV